MPVSNSTISLDNLPPRLSSPMLINDTPRLMTRVMLSDFESSEAFSKTKARALLNSELEGFRDGWAFVERNQERGTYNLYLHRSGAVALYYAKDLKLNETAQYPEGALYCITSEGLQKNGKVIATVCDNDSDIIVSGKIKAAVENQIPSSGSDRSFSPAMSLHRSRKLTAGTVSAIQSGMVNDDATDDNVSVASQKNNILG